MEVGLVRKVDIDQEMQQSYLDFAMSVIVARALPDARDGLKPVQRRILYAMYDMGLRPDSAFKKSARIVGEVLGKYHPHGDMAVYEAMARQAQDFSMRYPLVDGQGNFGSVDGDPPAAMRYTEARLKSFAIDMISQIDRETVDFAPNFDGSLNEPLVLPSALPNLLVNGSTGIAVGMATNIPPHNLSEVIDALVYMLKEWDRLDDINVADLMQFIKGPDFPTGGIILQDQENDLQTAYGTGRGRIPVRGRVHMEDTGRGRSRLIITELPYMTNKSSLIERIAEMVREGDLEGIADLRDESDRQGMRIVIELKANTEPDVILRTLYKRTPLESTIGIILLALVDNEPRLLSLKQALRVYLEHRLVVIRRRSEFDLERARQRAHILEGLRIAIANLDEVIKIIRGAQDVEQARERLIKRFKLSQVQAQAILDMQLRRLAALERRKIDEEYKELQAQIKELEALLKSPKRMRDVVQSELLQMKQLYGDRRRTQIVSLREGETAHMLLTTTDLTPAETAWVGVTPTGLIGRIRGGEAPSVDGEQPPRWMVRANTHHTLYLVSAQGQAAAVAVHAIPEVSSLEDGVPLHRATAIPEGEMLAGIFSVPPKNGHPLDETFIVTASAQGLVKKSAVSELPGPSSQRFTLTRVNAGDWLVGAVISNGSSELMMLSARGMAIRFAESEVRPMGLVAAGVNGMKLGAGDQVVAFQRVNPDGEVLLAASDGTGWRIPVKDFPVQGRYGMGVIAARPAPRVGLVGMLMGKAAQPGVALFEKQTAQLLRIDAIPASKRQSASRKVMTVKAGDALIAFNGAGDGLEYWDPQAVAALTVEKPARKRAAAAVDAAPATEKSAPRKKAAAPVAEKKAAAKKAAAPTRSTVKTATTNAPVEKPASRAAKTALTAPTAKKTTTTKAVTAAAKTPELKKAAPTRKTAGAAAAPESVPAKRAAAKKTTMPAVAAPEPGPVKRASTRKTATPTAETPKPAPAKLATAKEPSATAPVPVKPAASRGKRTAAATPVQAEKPAAKTPAAKTSPKTTETPAAKSTTRKPAPAPATKPGTAKSKKAEQAALDLFGQAEQPKPARKKKGSSD
ncbi:MAG TPA: DNA gyrase subunit A [Anaerolineaceae bacterium]